MTNLKVYLYEPLISLWQRSKAADALSTIIFVAGMQKGLEYLKQYPRTEAILVDADLNVTITRGLTNRFQADQGIAVNVLD